MITYQVLNDTDRYMSSGYITSLYMASVRVIVEHNQAELSKLEVLTANNIYHWSVWQGYRDNSA